MVKSCNKQGTTNSKESVLPDHLLVMYTMITWLHFHFHVPHVACNALLAFLALLLTSFNLTIMLPFITLQSATHALGVNPRIKLLAVCPKCQGVYPSSGSRHAQEKCTACQVSLFLPEYTRQGNCAIKSPVIKYLYRPLTNQIMSILKNPGVTTATLDL